MNRKIQPLVAHCFRLFCFDLPKIIKRSLVFWCFQRDPKRVFKINWLRKLSTVCFIFSYILSQHFYSAVDYMSKVNFRNTTARCEICSKLKIKSKWRALFWCLYCYFWTYFTYCSSVSIADFEQINAGWVTLLDSAKFFWQKWCTIKERATATVGPRTTECR